MPDLFFYRDPEEAEKEEQARQEQAAQASAQAAATSKVEESWGGEEMTTDWSNEPVPGIAPPAVAAGLNYKVSEEWTNPGAGAAPAAAAAPVAPSSDWAAEAPAPTPADQPGQWGGSSNWN